MNKLNKLINYIKIHSYSGDTQWAMGLIRAAAKLALDDRFRTPSLELKCSGTTFGAQKQKFSILRDSTWPKKGNLSGVVYCYDFIISLSS